jgi:hypothetical protein
MFMKRVAALRLLLWCAVAALSLKPVSASIDVFYNRWRRQSSLGYASPGEFELLQARCQAAA